MQPRHTSPAQASPRRTRVRSRTALYAVMLLLLPLSACDLWPFDDGRGGQGTATKTISQFDRSPKACPTACAMASASKHELALIFGSKKLPSNLEWGRPYVDGPGFKAFNECMDGDTENSARESECLKVAHTACIDACVNEETRRITKKHRRHQGRDEARKRARKKEVLKAQEPKP